MRMLALLLVASASVAAPVPVVKENQWLISMGFLRRRSFTEAVSYSLSSSRSVDEK